MAWSLSMKLKMASWACSNWREVKPSAWLLAAYQFCQAARYAGERRSREPTTTYRALALANWRLSEVSNAPACAPVSTFCPAINWVLLLLTSNEDVSSRLFSGDG